MLHAITLLAAMSATTGLMHHGKHCGGRMHLGHAKMVHAAAPATTCGTAPAATMPMTMTTSYPSPVATPQAPAMSRPMATPSAPVVTPTPSDAVPPAPVVPPAPPAPAPPAS